MNHYSNNHPKKKKLKSANTLINKISRTPWSNREARLLREREREYLVDDSQSSAIAKLEASFQSSQAT